MADRIGNTRPAQIAGEVIFTSYDGLRAEANGVLDFLTFDQRLLEMRSADILGTLPAFSSGNHGIILSQVVIDQVAYCILGAVCKIQDFNKRPGILGSAVCMARDSMSLEGIDTYLFDVLQSLVEDTFEEVWRNKPLPRKLNVLTNVPAREVNRDNRSKPNTELASLSGEVDLVTAIEAAMTAMRYSDTVGRTILLMQETANTRVYNQAYLHTIEKKAQRAEEDRRLRAQQARDAKEAEILRAQQEYAQQEALKQQRASAALENFEGRTRALEGRVTLSNLVAVPAEDSAQEMDAPPQSMDEMIAALQSLQKRIGALEKAVPRSRAQVSQKVLPIDSLMEKRGGLTPELEKALIYGSVALAVISILIALLFWRFSGPSDDTVAVPAVAERPAVVQTDTAEDAPAPIREFVPPITSASPPPRPQEIEAVDPDASATIDEDCSDPDTLQETLRCEQSSE